MYRTSIATVRYVVPLRSQATTAKFHEHDDTVDALHLASRQRRNRQASSETSSSNPLASEPSSEITSRLGSECQDLGSLISEAERALSESIELTYP